MTGPVCGIASYGHDPRGHASQSNHDVLGFQRGRREKEKGGKVERFILLLRAWPFLPAPASVPVLKPLPSLSANDSPRQWGLFGS